MTRALVVHDPDGLNPYGRELALLLARTRQVTLVLARDAEWVPDGVAVRRLLPGNRGGYHRLGQLWALVRANAYVAGRCLVRREDVLVAWSRSVLEDVMFLVLGWFGVRVAVVAHNPVPRAPGHPLRAWSTRALWRRARWVVTHGEGLAVDVEQLLPGRVATVCLHPLYRTWWQWVEASLPPPPATDRIRLLVLGQLRPDKGLDEVAVALAELSPADRERLVLCLCGRRPSGTDLTDLARLVEIDDRSSAGFVPDRDVAAAVRAADLLVAPLTHATQSGSVVLALSAELPVLAYAAGELGSIVADGGLVPSGDRSALAQALARVVRGTRGGGPRIDLAEWDARSERDWAGIFAS